MIYAPKKLYNDLKIQKPLAKLQNKFIEQRQAANL